MVLSKLTAAGIPIIQAMHIALENIPNKYLHSQIQNSINHIEQGGNLADALGSAKIYDTLAMGLINAGEQSGEMVVMFEKVAEYYERQFDTKVELVSVLIEPMMILFVGMMILVLALGIFVPLWDMSRAIRAR